MKVPYELSDRRPGDLAVVYADSAKAQRELGWHADRSLEDMCRDSWNFMKTHSEQK